MSTKLFLARAPAIIRDLSRFLPHLEKGCPRGQAIFVGRHRVGDVAFTYRMGAGFSGDVNRTHPFSVEPFQIDPTTANLFSFYGQAGVPSSTVPNTIRAVKAGDNALTTIYGILARPFPTQQMSGGLSSPFGAQVPPSSGIADILRWGYIMVQLNGQPTKGAVVNVWAAAANAGDLPGQLTTSATGGSIIALTQGATSFNGPPDASGIGEVYIAP